MKKIICVKYIFSVALSIIFIFSSWSSVSFCDEKIEKEVQKKQLEEKADIILKEKSKIDKQVQETKNRKKQKLGVKKNLDNQVAQKKQEIVSLSQKITSLNKTIVQKQNEITSKEEEIQQNQDLLKSRLKSGFMAPKISKIEAMMSKDKYSEFLTNIEYQARISCHDKQLVDDLTLVLKDIQVQKKQIESSKNQVEVAKGAIEKKKKELDIQVQEINEEVYSIQKEEEAYLKDSANLKKQMDALQAEIARICRELSPGDTPYVGGELCWPVPGYYNISSPYGPRSFDGFHTGTDIAGRGIYGKNIVAANDGKVIFVNTSGKGPYGNYITVDHGGGIATLYAHLSSFCCSYGQTVTKGQTIGLVGSTGFSTGPHLHFEVRINGKHTNPMAYFKKG